MGIETETEEVRLQAQGPEDAGWGLGAGGRIKRQRGGRGINEFTSAAKCLSLMDEPLTLP